MKQEYALITGAGNDLGKFFAKELAQRGVNLILSALPGEKIEMYCHQLRSDYSIETRTWKGDLAEKVHVLQLAKWVKENYPVNMLINNAGIDRMAAFEEASLKWINKAILLNIRAAALLTHQLIPVLKTNKPACVLNVTSIAGSAFVNGDQIVYSASSAFVSHFSRGLHEELKHSGIFVSAISPRSDRFKGNLKFLPKTKLQTDKINIQPVEFSIQTIINYWFKKRQSAH